MVDAGWEFRTLLATGGGAGMIAAGALVTCSAAAAATLSSRKGHVFANVCATSPRLRASDAAPIVWAIR